MALVKKKKKNIGKVSMHDMELWMHKMLKQHHEYYKLEKYIYIIKSKYFNLISKCSNIFVPLLLKGWQSEVFCPVWSPVNDVDAFWYETIGAQSLDTDAYRDTEVQVLQNTLRSGGEGEKSVVHELLLSSSICFTAAAATAE